MRSRRERREGREEEEGKEGEGGGVRGIEGQGGGIPGQRDFSLEGARGRGPLENPGWRVLGLVLGGEWVETPARRRMGIRALQKRVCG